MRGDIRDKLWRQLEAEILLQRHKTVVRACRRNSTIINNDKCSKPDGSETNFHDRTEHFGDVRTVVVKKQPDQGLGISITVSSHFRILNFSKLRFRVSRESFYFNRWYVNENVIKKLTAPTVHKYGTFLWKELKPPHIKCSNSFFPQTRNWLLLLNICFFAVVLSFAWWIFFGIIMLEIDFDLSITFMRTHCQ